MQNNPAIKIAGAGPSGLAAAITLAKAGHKVEVYERNRDCGQRFGGDLQGLENWTGKTGILEEIRRIGIKINFDCDPVYKFDITDGSQTRAVSSAEPFFYLVKRGPQHRSLDSGLKQQALDAGAEIKFNTSLQLNEARILATGPVARRAIGIAKGIIFETSAPDIAVCLLGKKAAHNGYSYLLITKGYGCMCAAVCGKLEKVNECFQETQQILTKLYDFNIRNPKSVGGIVSFSARNNFTSDGQLYAGEAAGLQDAFAGFGIRTALRSGHLAARSITEGFDYATAAKERFKPELTASVINRFLFEAFFSKATVLAAMQWISASKDPLGNLHRLYSMSLAKSAIAPLALAFLKFRYKSIQL